MTTRFIRYVPTGDRDAAVQAAKALARADGYRVRTISRVARIGRAWRVELVVDEPPTTHVGTNAPDQGRGAAGTSAPARPSWVSEAREDALDWRQDHVAKGGL